MSFLGRHARIKRRLAWNFCLAIELLAVLGGSDSGPDGFGFRTGIALAVPEVSPTLSVRGSHEPNEPLSTSKKIGIRYPLAEQRGYRYVVTVGAIASAMK